VVGVFTAPLTKKRALISQDSFINTHAKNSINNRRGNNGDAGGHHNPHSNLM